jgi:hypothetical protein
MRARVGQDRERHAPGTRQAIRNSAGANVHVSGDRNTVSVQVGRLGFYGHRPRLLAGVLVVLAIIATAVYLVPQNSGIPEYFQSGPEAGIVPAPSTSRCDNGTPDLLISPAENVLTYVSEAGAVSLDGRSAFLMDGDLNGTNYYWVVSDPDGDHGGMQLRWWTNPRTFHYCSVNLSGAPPAVLAQEGIRQVSTMAVPSKMNGEPVNFLVCVWYKAQKLSQQCSS